MDEGEIPSVAETNRNIFSFEDEVPSPDRFYEYSDLLSNSDVPIVIDNGSYKCRVGWANDEQPRMVFKNLIAKQKVKKSMETDVLIGNDIGNLEVARWQLKSPFDRNIVTQFDVQEQIFDYVFSHLGINTDSCVRHPIVMTEPVCNPNYCRDKMSELLFEYYHVPSIAYGIDGLFSYYYNHDACSDGLVVSCGYQTTHVLPILDGHFQPSFCRRLNYGGATIDAFMQRILQLKYPGHAATITLPRAEELVQKRCRIAVDFASDLNKWIDDSYYNNNVYKIQLPFNQLAAATLSAEQQRGRREQQARRLRELNIRRRQEKLVLEQDHLQQLMTFHEMIQNTEDDEASESVQRLLQEAGVTSVDELLQLIDKLSISVNNLKSKMSGEDEEVVVDVQDTSEAPTTSKDDQQVRQMKTSRSEPQLKKLKLDKKTMDICRVPLDGDKETMDTWLEELRKQRQDILSAQVERKQRRNEMRKRRTQASQNRMKILTELAQNAKQKKDDTFGMNEDDWNVYKQISKDGGDSDSETEMDKLEELESYLREYDPSFKNSSQEEVAFDVVEYYRVHIALEQIRIPELLFQPSMLGIDQAGLAEVIDFILAKFSPNDQQKLVQNIFLTGGCASFPNLSERLHKEVQEIRPFQSAFSIYTASNPVLDAWYGARKWAASPSLAQHSMTLVDYEEKGGEYLREHSASNRFIPTPQQ